MQYQLRRIVDDFNAVQQRVNRLAASVPAERWAQRRDPNRWSVGECIAHLNLTAHAYIPILTAAWEANPPTDHAPARYRRDFKGWLLGYAVGPLPRIGKLKFGRVKTKASFVPTGDSPCATILSEFSLTQDAQIQLTAMAEGRPLEQIQIASPFDSRISYNAFSCLMLLAPHQHRHLEQAEEVWG